MADTMSELEEEIAEGIFKAEAFYRMSANEYWRHRSGRLLAKAILNLEPIRELLRLHGEGKLMVLDDDQSWPDHGLPMNCGIGLSRLGVQQIHDRMEGLGWDRAIDKCNDTGFKRVHPPGVKCPSKP